MLLPRGSWIDLVRAVFEAERELVPYRRYPLPALQQRWGQKRLFETAFNFTHLHVLRHAFEALGQSGHGLHVAGGEMREETSFTFLVSFNVEPSGSGMHMAFLCHLLELPEAQVHNHYGPSETHVATAFTLQPDPDEWPLDPSIGRPIGNATACVLKPGLAPAPLGIPGDLYLGGACLARSYLGRPELTATGSFPTRSAPSRAPASTGPATRSGSWPRETWSTWDGSTTRSRSAASAFELGDPGEWQF